VPGWLERTAPSKRGGLAVAVASEIRNLKSQITSPRRNHLTPPHPAPCHPDRAQPARSPRRPASAAVSPWPLLLKSAISNLKSPHPAAPQIRSPRPSAASGGVSPLADPTTVLRLFVRLVAFPGHQEQASTAFAAAWEGRRAERGVVVLIPAVRDLIVDNRRKVISDPLRSDQRP